MGNHIFSNQKNASYFFWIFPHPICNKSKSSHFSTTKKPGHVDSTWKLIRPSFGRLAAGAMISPLHTSLEDTPTTKAGWWFMLVVKFILKIINLFKGIVTPGFLKKHTFLKTNMTSHLKMDGWKTIQPSFWGRLGLFKNISMDGPAKPPSSKGSRGTEVDLPISTYIVSFKNGKNKTNRSLFFVLRNEQCQGFIQTHKLFFLKKQTCHDFG